MKRVVDEAQRLRVEAAYAGRLLAAVPVRNGAVRERRRGGELVLMVPLARRWWTGRPWNLLLNFRTERGVALDRLGEEVWSGCDGRVTVERLIERFAERHRLRFHEARLSVVAFLRMLVERRVLVLVFGQGEQGADADPGLTSRKAAKGTHAEAQGARRKE